MKSFNFLYKHNQRLKLLSKENKLHFISFLKPNNKNSINLFKSNSINKSSNFNFNKKNNITINNSINHITNNITINNNSLNNSKNYYQTNNNEQISNPKETIFQNYKSYMDKKNIKIEISLKKPMNFSRNAHNSLSFNSSKSLYYLSMNNKKKKNPSFQNNNNNLKDKNSNYKLKLLYKIPNNRNLNLQNISNYICKRNKTNNNSLYTFTNNSINENNKKTKNNSKNSTTNNSINKTTVSKGNSGFPQLENNNKKISITINNQLNKFCNLNKKNDINNNKLYENYFLKRMIQKKDMKKANNLKKLGNNSNISNKTNKIYSDINNTNSNIQISKYVNNFLYKNKNNQLNVNNFNQESSKIRIYNSNYDIDDIEKNNIYNNDNKKEYIQETKNEIKKELGTFNNKDSSLDDTLKFSNCSSKVEEEGELGLDEVKDIIVYYNLNNEMLCKNYLFKKNDYNFFLEKWKYKYLNFFLK